MRVAVLVVCAACGRLGFQPGSSDADPADALPPCSMWGPFGAPTRIAELSTPYDDWSVFLASGDTIAFTSDWDPTGGDFKVGQRVRADTSAPFGPVTRLPAPPVSWTVHPSATPDGNSLYATLEDYTTTPTTGSIAHATRIDATTFSAFTSVTVPSIDYSHEPHISADELRLYYATNNVINTDGGTYELALATRTDKSNSFDPPVLISELETPSDETSPTLSADELEIFFASDRPGGLGGFDLYHATRGAIGEPFANIELLSQLNSTMDDVGPELSADGSTLYYNYDTKKAGGANSDVWSATRTCLQR